MPVSYTHLDVYKRQTLGGNLARNSPNASSLLSLSEVLSLMAFMNRIADNNTPTSTATVKSAKIVRKKVRDKTIPVSYTHLDVYKRQIVTFVITNIG